MTDLALLHTSPAHIAAFDALRVRVAPDASLTHIVREDLLARARREGVTREIANEVSALIQGSEMPVLCTCTTLGAVAEAAGALRIDRPVMRLAAETGGRVMLVWCLGSTAETSHALLAEEMARAGNARGIEPLFLPDAWPLFEDGDHAGFFRHIAEAVRAAWSDDLSACVLAQASMAGAARHLHDLPVLSSPEPALRAALGMHQS